MTDPAKRGHELLALARRAVQVWVREARHLRGDELGPLADDQPLGVFVCLKRNGRLRGCVGSVDPATESLAEEVARSAIQAATADPRFAPVDPVELAELSYQVDMLSTLEPVTSEQELDPQRYGILVSAGERRGLLLPSLEGVDDVSTQLAIARSKAGIDHAEPQDLRRFTVTRFEESLAP